MRKILVLALVTGSAYAAAQKSMPQIEVSYYQSNSIDLKAGGSGTMKGVMLGVSQSLVQLPFVGDARLGFNYLLNSGSSAEGNLWRLYAVYNTPSAGPNGIYGLTGFFYGNATARNNSFDSVSGFGFTIGVGIPLGNVGGIGVPGVPKTAIEAKYNYGSKAALRGFQVGVLIRF